MSRLNQFRRISLTIAEMIDAFRVVPRIILLSYGWMVWAVGRWYMSIPSVNETSCQADVLKTLLESGVTLQQAQSVACTIVDTIGGPTNEQTMFVSIVTGLSAVVIGFYLNTGKSLKWQGGVIDAIPEPTRTQYEHIPATGKRSRTSTPPPETWETYPGDDLPLGTSPTDPVSLQDETKS